jgi:hypothetical protein
VKFVSVWETLQRKRRPQLALLSKAASQTCIVQLIRVANILAPMALFHLVIAPLATRLFKAQTYS